MNRALLAELQSLRAYPSVTVLMNTTPGAFPSSSEIATAERLCEDVSRRLAGDVPEEIAETIRAQIDRLINEQRMIVAAEALALCVSPEFAAPVQLGRSVAERVIIDDTFATRDLVADLRRTALYRVITVSEQKARLLVGDRCRLVEERGDKWPMLRGGRSAASWTRDFAARLRDEQGPTAIPTVLAGVDRTIRRSIEPGVLHLVGFIAGNNDRTSWADLHARAWPLVSEWRRRDAGEATEVLERARSTRRFAGGIDEIWPFALEGRVKTLVVEDGFVLAARLVDGRVVPAADREAPDVIDDIIDETIEAVMRHNGSAVTVANGALHEHGRVAALLRY